MAPKPGARGAYVRKTDALGRTYYAERATGHRVSKATWELERETLSFVRAVESKREREGRPPAFPKGISPVGRPIIAPKGRGTGRREPAEPGREGPGGGTGGGRGGGRGREPSEFDDDPFWEGFEDVFEVEGDDETGGSTK